MKKDYTNYKYIEEHQVLKQVLWAWVNDGSRKNVLYGADFVYRTANDIVAAMLHNRDWTISMSVFWNRLDQKTRRVIVNTVAYVRGEELEEEVAKLVGAAWRKGQPEEKADPFADYFDELAKQEGGDD